jgi:four helix bundle protein
MGKFEDLKVWQRAKELAVYIYKLTAKGKLSRDYGLRDQMRRAAVSIPSNIAEGDEYGSNKQAVKFLHFAKGSAAELLTQAIIAHEIEYIVVGELQHIAAECKAISAMLTRLIQSRSQLVAMP